MILVMQDLPEKVAGFSASGEVTEEDYDNVLIPFIEDKIQRHGKIRILYHLGKDFKGYTHKAMLEDAKVGIQHLTAFEKIAVVSDVDWIINGVKVFKFVIPCPVKTYRNEELQEAKAWISE